MKKVFATAAVAFASAISMNAYAAGDIEAGRVAAEKANCFACHGKDYNVPTMEGAPKLAGQHRDYLEHALKAYKRGKGPNGRVNAAMGDVVKNLSKQDIQNISAYLSSLPGSLEVRK